MEPLNRQDKPPEPGPEREIVRVSPGNPFSGQILSASLWGCYTHWDGFRTRECTEPVENCAGHQSSLPLRWKGYLHVWDSRHGSFVFLEITPAAAKEILRLAPSNEPLRGLVLGMKRSGSSIKGRLEVSICRGLNLDRLPKPEDPEPILRKLWGWRRRG